jgi:hypothetical protein
LDKKIKELFFDRPKNRTKAWITKKLRLTKITVNLLAKIKLGKNLLVNRPQRRLFKLFKSAFVGYFFRNTNTGQGLWV